MHPNDHVNMGQSSNDTFPSAMHVATAIQVKRVLLPAMHALHDTLAQKAALWKDIVKVGRTHLQDATPIALGQELACCPMWSNVERISGVLPRLTALAQGGTAVGTGLNSLWGLTSWSLRKFPNSPESPSAPLPTR